MLTKDIWSFQISNRQQLRFFSLVHNITLKSCLCWHCSHASGWSSNILIAGFEITVDHPHTDVVRCSQLVRGITFFFSFSHFYIQRKSSFFWQLSCENAQVLAFYLYSYINADFKMTFHSVLTWTFSFFCSEQGFGTDFLFHGYQQVIILFPLLHCNGTL